MTEAPLFMKPRTLQNEPSPPPFSLARPRAQADVRPAKRPGCDHLDAGGQGIPRGPLPELRNDHGYWELTFEGRKAAVKCEPGAGYVAAMLSRPNQLPLPGFELAEAGSGHDCACFGRTAVLRSSSAQWLAAWLGRIRVLERILETETESEPVRAEVTRELEAMYASKAAEAAGPVPSAHEIARVVMASMIRFQQNLARATDPRGEPQALLRRFARHVKQFLLDPSTACGTGFVYRPAFEGR
jgi:hypothetical protein